MPPSLINEYLTVIPEKVSKKIIVNPTDSFISCNPIHSQSAKSLPKIAKNTALDETTALFNSKMG